MKIKSLNINYSGQYIITDVDDCIMLTSKSIIGAGYTKESFWFGNVPNDIRNQIFVNAKLTEWGKELLKLPMAVVELLTEANNRCGILYDKTGIKTIKEGYSTIQKINYLNSISVLTIYVDDKLSVIAGINNPLIESINYPPKNNYWKRARRRRI